MYGDTPPAVVAIEPALMQDATGMRLVAWGLEQLLLRRPVWAVIAPAPSLVSAEPGEDRAEAMRLLADDPNWSPPPRSGPAGTRATEATAAVLEHHLEQAGLVMPRGVVAHASLVPRPTSRLLLAGTGGLPAAAPVAAIHTAEALGIPEVVLWRRSPVRPATRAAAEARGVGLRVGLPGPLHAR